MEFPTIRVEFATMFVKVVTMFVKVVTMFVKVVTGFVKVVTMFVKVVTMFVKVVTVFGQVLRTGMRLRESLGVFRMFFQLPIPRTQFPAVCASEPLPVDHFNKFMAPPLKN